MVQEIITHWISPLGAESPAGENLEYDQEFLLLETAAQGQPGQEFSNTDSGTRITIDGQGADWQEVRRICESLMTRTRDLRIAVFYLRAVLHLEGFAGLETGLALIHGLLDQLWAHVHPQLDHDDEDDPTMRVNALAPLVSVDAVLDDLRCAWLIRSRQAGLITVRDLEVAQGRLPLREGDTAYSEAQIAGLMGEVLSEDANLVESPLRCIQALTGISDVLQERIGAMLTLDFKPLLSILQSISRAFPGAALSGANEDLGSEVEVSTAASAVASAVGLRTSGEISGRQDVERILGQLIQYLERNEPTNPAQLLLRRAQRVMHMSFLEAIDELAPDGLQQAERSVGGSLGRGQE